MHLNLHLSHMCFRCMRTKSCMCTLNFLLSCKENLPPASLRYKAFAGWLSNISCSLNTGKECGKKFKLPWALIEVYFSCTTYFVWYFPSFDVSKAFQQPLHTFRVEKICVCYTLDCHSTSKTLRYNIIFWWKQINIITEGSRLTRLNVNKTAPGARNILSKTTRVNWLKLTICRKGNCISAFWLVIDKSTVWKKN